AARVHPLRDVGALPVDGGHHRAGVAVDAVLRVGVADRLQRAADDGRDVDVGGGGDLAGDHGDAGGHQGLARHAARGVVAQDGVEDGVGDLVGDLVRVPLRDRL